jgi:hypothetical protein
MLPKQEDSSNKIGPKSKAAINDAAKKLKAIRKQKENLGGLGDAGWLLGASKDNYTKAIQNARSTAGENANINPNFGSVGSATHGKIGK